MKLLFLKKRLKLYPILSRLWRYLFNFMHHDDEEGAGKRDKDRTLNIISNLN